MYSAQNSVHKLIERIFPVKIKKVIVTIILYTTLTALIVYGVYNYVPVAIKQIVSITREIAAMISNLSAQTYDNPIIDFLVSRIREVNIGAYIEGKSGYLLGVAGKIVELLLYIFMSLILSLFFILEKDRVVNFINGFKESRIGGFFSEIQYFGNRLANSFGKVVQAQFMIAVCNSILSLIGLWLLGFHQLLGLGVMIFVLSLIPVAGVIISLVPLSIIAFRMGGFTEILYVVALIAVIHSFESYFLNPKLMSAKTNLPIFFTFLILIVSEHLMGIWGLIIGIPIFIFILDLIDYKKQVE